MSTASVWCGASESSVRITPGIDFLNIIIHTPDPHKEEVPYEGCSGRAADSGRICGNEIRRSGRISRRPYPNY